MLRHIKLLVVLLGVVCVAAANMPAETQLLGLGTDVTDGGAEPDIQLQDAGIHPQSSDAAEAGAWSKKRRQAVLSAIFRPKNHRQKSKLAATPGSDGTSGPTSKEATRLIHKWDKGLLIQAVTSLVHS
jgi:hypothetical protein